MFSVKSGKSVRVGLTLRKMSSSKGGLVHLLSIIYLSLPLLVVYSQNPVIFNLGDSLSDTGGYVAGTGNAILPPYGRIYFHKPAGRLCDGRTLIDFLTESLNTSLLRPYLQSLGLNYTNGANFAIIGASTLPKTGQFNLITQVRQFVQFQAYSLELTAQGYTNFVGEEGFKNALYIVDIGGNDLLKAISDLSYEDAVESVPSYVAEIEYAILALYELGGRKFWVPNSHPLGCSPAALSTLSYNASELDQYGCYTLLNELVYIFNDQLRNLTEQLRTELENVTIVYVDIYAIRHELIANPTLYGFDGSPVMACCGYGGPPYNFNSSLLCGDPGYNVCDEKSRYISWDGMHYSEAANEITAAKILTTNYNTPPLDFDFFVTRPARNKYKLKRNDVIFLDSTQ